MPSSNDFTTASDQSSASITIVVSGGSSSAYDNSHIDASLSGSDAATTDDASLSWESSTASDVSAAVWSATRGEAAGADDVAAIARSLTSSDAVAATSDSAFYHASADAFVASDFTPAVESSSASDTSSLLRIVVGSESVTASQARGALSRSVQGYDAVHVSGYRQIGVFPRKLYPSEVFARSVFGTVASFVDGEYSLNVVAYSGDDAASMSVEVGYVGKGSSDQFGGSENVASLAKAIPLSQTSSAAESSSVLFAIPSSESAAISEASSIAKDQAAAEAGGVTETSSASRQSQVSESSSAVDAAVVVIFASASDSTSSAESSSLAKMHDATEQAGVSEASSAARQSQVSDSSSALESSVIYAAASASDSASVSDSSYVALSLQAIDAILATESRSLLRTLASSDTASLADIGIYIVLDGDTAQAVDSLLSYARILYSGDSAVAADAAALARITSQSSTAVDASALQWTLSAIDSASAADTSNLYVAVAASETASASESALPKNTFAFDFIGSTDATGSLSTNLAGSDSGSTGEGSYLTTIVQDTATAAESSVASRTQASGDAFHATDSISAFYRSTGQLASFNETSAIVKSSTVSQSIAAAEAAAVLKLITGADSVALAETARSLGFFAVDLFGVSEQSAASRSVTISSVATASDQASVVFAWTQSDAASLSESSSLARTAVVHETTHASEAGSTAWALSGHDELARDRDASCGPFNKMTFVPRLFAPNVYAPAVQHVRTAFVESAFVVWSMSSIESFTAAESGSTLTLATTVRERIGASESATLSLTMVGVEGVHAAETASVFQYIPISSADAAALAEYSSVTTTPELADIWGAIHAWFLSSGLSPSFPGGLWLGFAPSATVMPYIVVNPDTATELFQSCTEYRIEMQPFIVKLYAPGAEQCRLLGKLFERKYNHAKLPLQGDYVMAMLRRGRQLKYWQPQKTNPVGKAHGFVDAWINAINYDCFIVRNEGALY